MEGWSSGRRIIFPPLVLSLPPLLSSYFEDKDTTEQRSLKLKGREEVTDKAKFKRRAGMQNPEQRRCDLCQEEGHLL